MSAFDLVALQADRPVFVGGMFKSGTSLLRALLGQHPDLFAGLETHWFEMDGEGAEQRLDWLAEFYGEDAEALQEQLAKTRGAEAFLDAMMARAIAVADKSRWVEKTPANILHIARILAAWPDARFLHIERDPRDILASQIEAGRSTVLDSAAAQALAGKHDIPETIAGFALTWTAMVGAADAFEDAPGRLGERYLKLNYESLIADTETTMRRVLSFIDADWDPAVVRFDGRGEDLALVKEVTGRTSRTLERLARPLTDKRVGLWQRVLSDADLVALTRAIKVCGGEALWDSRVVATDDTATRAAIGASE